ncbi:Cytochrome c oxidase polypeptide VIa [Operophtera brumata]|uniref:Cytochrome c oxidase polypeptide VIa n=1 Tax=Operophtera brumata TaxID=104452 RepID=A0A0L7LQ05_OPEBR|nr:Cytochrome c oxidase polypeptide VIa [Operophtera brumata]
MLFRASQFHKRLFNVSNFKVGVIRPYSLCCPPRPSGGCGCPNQVPGGGRKIVPPTTCRPGSPPPNPCVPVYHHGKDTWKKYKYIVLFVCIPAILLQAFRAFSHGPPPKGHCRDYEYMRLRTKRFPWGEGVKSLFHNDHLNHLPGECEPPPLDCDE